MSNTKRALAEPPGENKVQSKGLEVLFLLIRNDPLSVDFAKLAKAGKDIRAEIMKSSLLASVVKALRFERDIFWSEVKNEALFDWAHICYRKLHVSRNV